MVKTHVPAYFLGRAGIEKGSGKIGASTFCFVFAAAAAPFLSKSKGDDEDPDGGGGGGGGGDFLL